MITEEIKNHIEALELHDNGCLKFLEKHNRKPEYIMYFGKKKYTWFELDYDHRYQHKINFYLPSFLIREIKTRMGDEKYSAIISGHWCVLYDNEKDAFAEVCLAWNKMKSVHRLILSIVPELIDIYM